MAGAHASSRAGEGEPAPPPGACNPWVRVLEGREAWHWAVMTPWAAENPQQCSRRWLPGCTQRRCPGLRTLHLPALTAGMRVVHPLQVPVLYPFGHGLSYTTFAYSRLSLDMAAGTAGAGGRGAAGAAAAQGAAGAAEAGPIAAGCLRGCTAPLLRVSVDITNIGGMAADEVALLLLSYAGPPLLQGQAQQQQQHSQQLGAAGGRASQQGTGTGAVLLHRAPCTPPGGRASRGGSGRRLEGLPRQSLVGFERVPLAPGQSATVHFTLAEPEWQPFSPLAEELGGSGNSEGRGGHACPPPPYCGTYVLRVGQQQLEVTLVSSSEAALDADAAPAA